MLWSAPDPRRVMLRCLSLCCCAFVGIGLARPDAAAFSAEHRLKAHVIQRSPEGFLRVLVVKLSGSRQQPFRIWQERFALNPVAQQAEVFYRTRGADVANGLVVMRGRNGQAYTILREQARAPLALRLVSGSPGGRSFTLSESYGGSLEVRGGRPESIGQNAIHELLEELGLCAQDRRGKALWRQRILMRDIAITPHNNAGAASLVLIEPTQAVSIDNVRLAEAKSGEVAETGARAFDQLNLVHDAVRFAQGGQMIDGRSALLLLHVAHRLRIPLPEEMRTWPSVFERHLASRLMDSERTAVAPDAYSSVQLTEPKDPEWKGETLTICSRRVCFGKRNGETKWDPFEHKIALAPDQVSELPLVFCGGRPWVGLVPTICPGILARETPDVAPLLAHRRGNRLPFIQWRGIVRPVEGYRPSRHNGGNLGVTPRYERTIRDAHERLTALGLEPTAETINLGQFNASPGEEAFQTNLIVRTYGCGSRVNVKDIHRRTGQIRFLPLSEAVDLFNAHPRCVDQLTQLQLYWLALKQGDVFRWE